MIDRYEKHNNWFQQYYFKNVNVKPSRCDRMYMDKGLIEGKLYQLTDRFNERNTYHKNLYYAFLNNNIHFMIETPELVRH